MSSLFRKLLRFSLLAALCPVLLISLVCLAEDKKEEQERAPRFVLGLTDGSKLACTPILKSIRITTLYATMDVPVDRIAKIVIDQKEGIAAAHMKNGDLLKGKLELQTIKVKAIFGTVSISMDHVAEMVEAKTALSQKVNDTPANRNACINNLRMIDEIKMLWALEEGGMASDIPTLAQIADYIENTNTLFCPAATGTNRSFENSYEINAINMKPTCKILPAKKDGSPHHSLHYRERRDARIRIRR